MTEQQWKILKITAWLLFFCLILLTAYVNWFLPRGKFLDTGDVNCPDYGKCEEQYYEDNSSLTIPKWAKSLRNNGYFLPALGLGAVGFYAGAKQEDAKNRIKSTDRDKLDHKK